MANDHELDQEAARALVDAGYMPLEESFSTETFQAIAMTLRRPAQARLPTGGPIASPSQTAVQYSYAVPIRCIVRFR
jgi:hypothetical protein